MAAWSSSKLLPSVHYLLACGVFWEEALVADRVMCSTHDDEAIWHSNTAPKKDVILVVQNDGNLVLYEGTPVWASSTTPSA
jgi:hypothetical protein